MDDANPKIADLIRPPLSKMATLPDQVVASNEKWLRDLVAIPALGDHLAQLTANLSPLSKIVFDSSGSGAFVLSPLLSPPDSEASALRRQIVEKEEALAAQAAELRKKTDALQKATEEKAATQVERQELENRVKTLSEDYEHQTKEFIELQKQKDLGSLLDRVCSAGAKRLLRDELFKRRFEETKTCMAFVLAIDIRRSTDLMLRGKTPQQYAEFLNSLCLQLTRAIRDHFGVIDKFTGDGLLAYFPDFFAGNDAGYYALATAQECHALFAQHYQDSRNRFTVALKEVGLGIGIDYGEVHLLRVTADLTVLGAPVVYACRLSSAPAGRTFVNHSALTEFNARCPKVFEATEIEFQLKHEGLVLCHTVTLAHTRYTPAAPDWIVNSDVAPVAASATTATNNNSSG